MNSVLVLGSINKDIIVTTARAPKPGETLLGRCAVTGPGGKGANQAVASSRLGAKVQMFGAVGSDADGDAMLTALSLEGVDVSCVARGGAQTGSAILTVTDDGENSIIVVPGANNLVGHHQVEQLEAAIRAGDILVAQLEVPLTTVADALGIAKGRGARTILNAAPAQDITALLPHVDVLVVNETEASLLWGAAIKDVDDARRAATDFVREHEVASIITLGGSGAVLADNEGAQFVPAHVVNVVDTTGAGDTFVGALATFLAEGMELSHAVNVAARAGAATCTALGAQASMPDRDSVLTGGPSER